MGRIMTPYKACSVNPLKMSQPIGAALAFLGIESCLPILHGSQGCTSFGLVLFVRHFREAIPMQTTAMNEVTSILGRTENVMEALLTLNQKAQPSMIGLCTTGLTETKGEDIVGAVKEFRQKHPEMNQVAIVPVSTPDFTGAFQDGWSIAVKRIIEELAEGEMEPLSGQVNILAGPYLTPADIEEIREIIISFGLHPIILPDLSGSLDGHIPDDFSATTMGGTSLAAIRDMGRSEITVAIGASMLPAAEALQKKSGVPFVVFESLTGLGANDRFLDLLYRLSGEPVSFKYRRQRSRLVDAMLDGHFFFGKKKIAIGADPDLLFSLSSWFTEMGSDVTAAVTTTQSPILEKVPAEEVLIGDLEDLEMRGAGCDLIVTHSHGRQASARSGIPLFRVGIPIFDRLGTAHQVSVGYQGTMRLIFEVGNIFLGNMKENGPETWNALVSPSNQRSS